MLYQKSWARAWLGFGLVWFLGAIALAPSNKIYQQGIILFLWLPTLIMAWSGRRVLLQAWRLQPALWASVLLLLVWSALSLLWSATDEGGRDGKRLVYILLFLMAFPLLAQAGLSRVRCLLQVGAGLLAIAALVSIVLFYGIHGRAWLARLQGIGEISHPILGAYVIAAAVLCLLHKLPRQRGAQLAWGLALAALGAFVVLSQSRGAAVALVLTTMARPLWYRNRQSQVFAGLAIVATCIAFFLMSDVILRRGASHRPEIFEAALQMIGQHPWGGLGLGSVYQVVVGRSQFDHTHNMFTHAAVELGVPGMVLWVAVWLFAFAEIVRARHTGMGKALLGLWLYSTLAMQFDAASLTDTPRAEWFISWLPVGLVMLLPWGVPKTKPVVKFPVQPEQRAR